MEVIDKQAVIDILATMQGLCTSKDALIQNSKIWQQIKDLPPAGHPIGHWIDIDTQAYTWKVRCSNCGHERSMMSTQGVYPNFCEHCGANMRGKNNE